MAYRCPKCGSTERLKVEIVTWAELSQDGDSFDTSEIVGDHEWGEESWVACDGCGWSGKVSGLSKAVEGGSGPLEPVEVLNVAASHGFYLWDTGGGLQAFRKDLGEFEYYILITDDGGGHIPKTLHEMCIACLYGPPEYIAEGTYNGNILACLRWARRRQQWLESR